MVENFGFERNRSFISEVDNQRDIVEAQINAINTTADVAIELTNFRSKLNKLWNNYQWRMRHYFYIHLSIFFVNTLVCSVIIWNTEQRQVAFVDCWFISATCVFTCGLQTYPFYSFSLSSQIILLIFTIISGMKVKYLHEIF